MVALPCIKYDVSVCHHTSQEFRRRLAAGELLTITGTIKRGTMFMKKENPATMTKINKDFFRVVFKEQQHRSSTAGLEPELPFAY